VGNLGIYATKWRMIWLDIRTLAKNENKFFKLASKKNVTDETKERVAKLILILQKRMNLVKEMIGSIHMFRQ
jgi:hypothetical protein